jgi:hypothetical protein
MKSRIVVSLAVFGAFVLGLLSFHPIAKAVESFAVVKCAAASSACDGGSNSSSGSGVAGTSVNGNGVVAQTKYPSKSGTNFKSGLLGQDLSTTGKFDVGVWGASTRGTGLLGTTTSFIGVNGISQSGTGVWGQINGGAGQPTGVVGVDASQNANAAGVAGQTNVGSGVVASTLASTNQSQALLALAPNGGFVFVGAGAGNYGVATIDGNGNVVISGLLFSSGQCQSGCLRSRRVQSYGTSAATPTLEDTGEAQLVAGAAYVRLDPDFLNAIDPRQGYFVLITPEAETRGLYVTQRTAAGFAVRENPGGHSNGAFAYRIVAHPFGVRERRLPFVDLPKVSTSSRAPQMAELR